MPDSYGVQRWDKPGSDRTYEELKQKFHFYPIITGRSSDRTYEELKLEIAELLLQLVQSLDRTYEELKHGLFTAVFMNDVVWIVPMRN